MTNLDKQIKSPFLVPTLLLGKKLFPELTLLEKAEKYGENMEQDLLNGYGLCCLSRDLKNEKWNSRAWMYARSLCRQKVDQE